MSVCRVSFVLLCLPLLIIFCARRELLADPNVASKKVSPIVSLLLLDDQTLPNSLTVGVVNRNTGSTIPNALVVLGNAEGAMISVATTDAEGQVVFPNRPRNATVTVAVDFGGVDRRYLFTVYEVNSSFVGIPIDHDEQLGTVSIDVVDQIGTWGGCVSSLAGGFCESRWFSPIQGIKVVYPPLQTDEKLSFLVWGWAENRDLLGYGYLLDQPFASGMQVDLTLNMSDFVRITLTLNHMNNIPADAEKIHAYASISRKPADLYMFEGGLYEQSSTRVPRPFPASFELTMIPNIGDSFLYTVQLDYPHGGSEISKRTNSLADQRIDLVHILGLPSNRTITGAGNATPTLTWTGNDTFADVQWISFSANQIRYSLVAPSSRNQLAFPELPDSLDSFRPYAITNFSLSSIEGSCYSGAVDFITKVHDYAKGVWVYPSEFLFTDSYGYR